MKSTQARSVNNHYIPEWEEDQGTNVLHSHQYKYCRSNVMHTQYGRDLLRLPIENSVHRFFCVVELMYHWNLFPEANIRKEIDIQFIYVVLMPTVRSRTRNIVVLTVLDISTLPQLNLRIHEWIKRCRVLPKNWLFLNCYVCSKFYLYSDREAAKSTAVTSVIHT